MQRLICALHPGLSLVTVFYLLHKSQEFMATQEDYQKTSSSASFHYKINNPVMFLQMLCWLVATTFQHNSTSGANP